MVKSSDLLVDKSLHGLAGHGLRTGVTSFGHQFDFHDVTYHIRPYNVDTRRRNVVLQLLDVQSIRKITAVHTDKTFLKRI